MAQGDRQHPSRMSRYEDDDIMSLRDYIAICMRYRGLVVVVAALVFILGAIYTSMHRPVYKATAKVLVTTQSGTNAVDEMPLLANVQALTRNRSVETQVQIISSYDLLNEAYQQLPATVRRRDFGSMTLPQGVVRVEGKRDTDIIEISARAKRPSSASLLANQVAALYFERDLAQSVDATRQVRLHVEETLKGVGQQLTQAQAALAQYKQQHRIVEMPSQMQNTTQQLSALQRELDSTRAQYAGETQATQALQTQLAREQATVVANTTVVNNPRFASTLERLDQLLGERVALLQEYTLESVPVTTLDARIAEEQLRLKAVAQTLLGSRTEARNPVRDDLLKQYATSLATREATGARVRMLEQSLLAQQVAAGSLPEQERQLTELGRNLSLLENTYTVLTQKYYAVMVNEHAKLPNGRIVEHARPPQEADPPRSQYLLFFALLAGVLGIGAAIAADRLSAPVRRAEAGLTAAAIPPLDSTNMTTR